MCGVFGIVAPQDANISDKEIEKVLQQLYLFSESRGKESAGIHIYLPASGRSWTLKSARPASEFIKSREYKALLKEVFTEAHKTKGAIAAIAHSRLVTNGRADDAKNNQPICYNGISIVHNGIIVNVDELWKKNPDLRRAAEVDTEVAAAILSKAINDAKDPATATSELFRDIKGTASIAWLEAKSDGIVLATNTGDLFYYLNSSHKFMAFASERYILEQAMQKALPAIKEKIEAAWVSPKTGLHARLSDLQLQEFTFISSASANSDTSLSSRHHKEYNIINNTADERFVRYNAKNLAHLKRCSCCILPETFPFISFDEKGVCNYCRGYQPKYKNLNPEIAKHDFFASLEKYRTGGGNNPNVIVPFSGGRDSCYGLHLIKKEFNLTPITFTYDWGMVTDLARRNIARFCGELGVQNILVSADIKTKRENIRKNVAAWLKKPDLGMVPLFMAGDKHFFSLVNKLKRQTGINLDLWCANPLENTDFKSGFCGIAPDFDKTRLDYLSMSRKLKMIAHFAGQFMNNTSYLNSSLIDTFTSFLAYYVEPRRDFYFIFNHMVWNEDEVNKTIIGAYDFEMSPDSPSTWRIGDGTAPFYNYIYLTARGFSEFDTFRSNQIREGMITREYAMEQVLLENQPRIASLRWYLDTIGLDFNDTIKRVNMLDTMNLHG
ncbi:MAG: hypothetical protein EBR02_00195 [Alphaproteobacteria bacterium]|nr:hypothetical protein [Alphaproteobacteria bacterium]